MRILATILACFFAFSTATAWAADPAAAKDKVAGATDAKSTNIKAEKKTDKKDSHAISTSPDYLGMEPIYTTILDGDAVVGTLMLGVGLDVSNPQLREYVTQNMPLLRDLYVRTMLSYTSISIRPWRQPNAEEIAARLQTVTDRKLKKNGAARVLLAQVAIRLNK